MMIDGRYKAEVDTLATEMKLCIPDDYNHMPIHYGVKVLGTDNIPIECRRVLAENFVFLLHSRHSYMFDKPRWKLTELCKNRKFIEFNYDSRFDDEILEKLISIIYIMKERHINYITKKYL